MARLINIKAIISIFNNFAEYILITIISYHININLYNQLILVEYALSKYNNRILIQAMIKIVQQITIIIQVHLIAISNVKLHKLLILITQLILQTLYFIYIKNIFKLIL